MYKTVNEINTFLSYLLLKATTGRATNCALIAQRPSPAPSAFPCQGWGSPLASTTEGLPFWMSKEEKGIELVYLRKLSLDIPVFATSDDCEHYTPIHTHTYVQKAPHQKQWAELSTGSVGKNHRITE